MEVGVILGNVPHMLAMTPQTVRKISKVHKLDIGHARLWAETLCSDEEYTYDRPAFLSGLAKMHINQSDRKAIAALLKHEIDQGNPRAGPAYKWFETNFPVST